MVFFRGNHIANEPWQSMAQDREGCGASEVPRERHLLAPDADEWT